MNTQKLTLFITHHWLLCASFVVAFIALMVLEARSKGTSATRLTAQQLTQLINRESALVIDIRDATAFNDSHIVNAVNIPLADISQNIKRLEKDKHRPIVLVCALGQKSPGVMNQLRLKGFTKVYMLAGGMHSWRNTNMPTVKS